LAVKVEGGDPERGGVEEVGGDEDENGLSCHCEATSGRCSPLLGNQAFMSTLLSAARGVSGGDAFIGLGEGDGATMLIDSGCRMLKI
jgi:hypothetical protein